MNSVTYSIVEEIYILAKERRVSYGVVAYANAEEDGTATILASARDVSSDKRELECFVEKCNKMDLSLSYFKDMIEDFLAG